MKVPWHLRCRKCGMVVRAHAPYGYCTGAFDPFHVTGVADFARVPGPYRPDISPEDFVRSFGEP